MHLENTLVMYGIHNISQLHTYVKMIRILAIGYLPILLITPLKLKEIL